MREGDVVLVLGKLDDRVRDNFNNGEVTGTVVQVTKDEVSILLENGDLWHGLKREAMLLPVYKDGEAATQSDQF